jgi:ribosome-associated toxin RatA of RatAB toxin-antitoxin module
MDTGHGRYLAGRGGSDRRPDPARRRLLGSALGLAICGAAHPARAATPDRFVDRLSVDSAAGGFVIQASAEVESDLATAWATLSDYDRLPEFVPDLSESRTVSRSGMQAVVRQVGRVSFGPFFRTVRLLLSVREEPLAAIDATAIDGDVRSFEGRYDLRAAGPGRTAIGYRARLQPAETIARRFGALPLRAQMQRQFGALLHEVERRARAAA